jgi:cation diffusion facilitator family transporter
MKHCCEDKASALEAMRDRQGRTLKVVLALNAAMFVIELTGGLLGRSTALLGDALDMFGDAAVYGLSLYVLHKGAVWRGKASVVKGLVMTLLGTAVLVEAVVKALRQTVPHVETMGVIGLLALAANVGCVVLLVRHRADDVNMRSAWICSRNDIVANGAVLGAALAVGVSGSWWPDVLVGAGIATLFVWTGISVVRDGLGAIRAGRHAEYELAAER